jgi:hypothetical protein
VLSVAGAQAISTNVAVERTTLITGDEGREAASDGVVSVNDVGADRRLTALLGPAS